jgi:uncharacterized protein (DUF2141 family)
MNAQFKKSKKAAVVVALFVLALPALGNAEDGEPAKKTDARIAVNVGNFRNQNGYLGCRLLNQAEGFPESSKGAVQKRVAISGKTARCDFENVAPGTYAISVMHDENGNGKLDKSFFGVPTEGYGASNNHTYAMSAPKWEESKFVVEAGKSVGLGISLRY